MKIAIMGAGSLGVVIGGQIAASGRDAVLVAANEQTAGVLNSRGAVITGAIEKTVPVRALTAAQLAGFYDVVFLLTKLDANAVALRQLRPHLHAASIVCTLQNGMPEDEVAASVGRERTVGGVVLIGATRLAPGVSRVTSSREIMCEHAFEIGELNGRLTPRLGVLQEILAAVGGCRLVENLPEIRWAKLLVNATFGALTAALGCPCQDILANDDAMAAVARIADETVRTAHACGWRLASLQGMDMEDLAIRPGERPADKFAFLRRYFTPYAETKGSLLQDLEKGRKTEIGHISGYICRRGAEKGVPTPYNRLVVELVTAAEQAGQAPDFATNLAILRRYREEA